ncbi:carbohydrate ABC transporter substrate-binding protein [Eisenbergiella sp. OF01-20]|nr:carbohydrate ABC transporter substrate-binding protein [Eisenbergiella sp. OF01-20]
MSGCPDGCARCEAQMGEEMKKKLVSILLCAAMGVTALAGCGNSSGAGAASEPAAAVQEESKTEEGSAQATESQESAPAEAAGVDGGGETLNVMCHSSWRTEEANAVFDYVAEKCNVKFEFEEVPEGGSGNELIFAKMQSGEVPDILWWQGAKTSATEIGEDLFMELSGGWTQDYNASILESPNQTYNGRLICAPFGDVTVFGMCYNKQVFADNKIAVPQTWEEFLAACETLKAAGVTPMYISGTTDNEWTLQIIPIDARLKQESTVPGSIASLNSHEKLWADMEYMQLTFERMKEMKDQGYIQDTFLSDSYADAQEALLTGTAAMYPQATWIYAELTKLAESEEELDNIGFFPIPATDAADSIAYTETPTGFVIPAGGKKAELAAQIVGELVSKEAMTEYYKLHQGIPAVNGVEVELSSIPADVSALMEAGKTNTLPNTLYSTPSMASDVQAMLAGDKTPEEVLAGYDTDWDTYAKEAGNPDWGY